MVACGCGWGWREHKGNFGGNLYLRSVHLITVSRHNECIWVQSGWGTKWKQLNLFCFSGIRSSKIISLTQIFSRHHLFGTSLQFQVVDHDYFYTNNFSPWNLKKGKKILFHSSINTIRAKEEQPTMVYVFTNFQKVALITWSF